ncbi:MAG: SgcJ/EcaC family oxidoreductase [Verrucomicrobia bacterium]|nr:SgcJ/EcaC family oxidoreductase [Verrucomicrobiota bacterium]
MNTTMLPLALALLTLTAARSQQEDPNNKNLEALASNAAAFVAAYNKADPVALAKLFLPEGELVLATGEVLAGRDEIRDFYTEALADENKPQAALEASSVRFVTPALAIEDGTLHVTQPSGEVTSHNYTAVQVKQENGTWLTASIRDEIEDRAPASDKLRALKWVIGDWLIEKDGTRTFLSFKWSDDGPYIDGKALTEQPGEDATAATYRIGWNNQRKGFVSWGFDALGGYNKSEWTATDDGWLLRTTGVTADGEISQATQCFAPDPSQQSFTWSRRDQTIDDEVQPDQTIRVVKRPPTPAAPATDR